MNHQQQIGPERPAQTADSEAGFMLVFAVFLVALVVIAMAVAAPVVAKNLQRDKELESEHRAEQYVRAIRLYYRKFHSYPPSIDALENTSDVRFLRKQYIDPLTGQNNWRIIHVGQNKTTVKGFFGEPLGGLNTAGAGGGLGSASTLGAGFGGAATPTGGGSTTIGSSSPLSAGFDDATIGSSSDSTTGTTGTGSSTTGTTSASALSGGGPIMGVGTSKTGVSILTPNEQTTYETWEFIYDPKIEMLYQQSNILGGGSVSSQSTSSFGSNAVTGQSNSTNGLGTTTNGLSNTSGFGSTSTSDSTSNSGSTSGSTTPNSPTSNSPFNSSPF